MFRRLRAGRALAAAALAALALPAASPAHGTQHPPGVEDVLVPPERAMLVFAPGSAGRGGADRLLRALEARRGLAVGLVSATQGAYSEEQALLDVTQGIRVSPTAYDPRQPDQLDLAPAGGGGGRIVGWRRVLARAETAPATIRPGLLAGSIPGGAAYVGVAGERHLDAAAAADRRGRVASVSIGPAATVAARALDAVHAHRLVVVDLPASPVVAMRQLDRLLAQRRPDELAIVTQRPPDGDVLQFLAIALAGRATDGRGLTSDTTHREGVVTGIDVTATVLDHLRLGVPGNVTGAPIRPGDRVSASELEDLRERYGHVAPRRIRALQLLLAAWLALLAACALAGRARVALRVGALAFLWVPVVVLVPGLLDPSSGLAEGLSVAVVAFALGALTDRLVAWPRAPAVPAAACLSIYLADLATGSNLITLSLLGPNPRAGARFYGIGNELEPALPAILFAGLAAAMASRPRSRGAAALFAVAGTALALAIGSGLLGADVGGVITGSVGAAVAAMLMLPGRVGPRLAAAVCVIVPVAAVGALALLDQVTGAKSHFARHVLEAQGDVSFLETVRRRYELALHALVRGRMPFVFGAAAIVAAVAFAYRDRLYGRLPGPAWGAALAGTLAAGIAGALTNDSGPLLFVVAVFVLAVLTAYLRGAPERPGGALHSSGSPTASRAGAPVGPAAREVAESR
jgi:hypothetical protein